MFLFNSRRKACPWVINININDQILKQIQNNRYNDFLSQFINIIEMKPILSALGFFAAGSLIFMFKNYVSDEQSILEKQMVRLILIALRKRFFSTLRQIAFVVNNIKANESDFEPKKISEIVMKDGGSGNARLNLIEQLTMKSFNITRQVFQASCNYYKGNDYQIRLLLKNISMDIQLALQGTIQNYNGPTISISPDKVIHIYRDILKRRMENIKSKLVNQATNQDCIKREFMIQDYLEIQGIKHERESNEKILISILESNYRQDADFRVYFEHLQIQMSQFMEEIEHQQQEKHHKMSRSANPPETVHDI